LGEPKSFQVEEDTIIVEDPSYTIHRRIPFKIGSTRTVISKGVEEGRRGTTRLVQSKETILGLGGSVLEESGMPPYFEVTELETLKM
jgi:hypothetical protein